jgi:hypothetical protein
MRMRVAAKDDGDASLILTRTSVGTTLCKRGDQPRRHLQAAIAGRDGQMVGPTKTVPPRRPGWER